MLMQIKYGSGSSSGVMIRKGGCNEGEKHNLN